MLITPFCATKLLVPQQITSAAFLDACGGALARRPHRPGTQLVAARVIELAQRGIHGGAKPFRGAVDGFRPHMD